MSEIKTLEELTEIEARANAATPGPWRTSESEEDRRFSARLGMAVLGPWLEPEPLPRFTSCLLLEANHNYPEYGIANTRFVAAARTDVPALTAALREAWESEGRANDMLHETCAENTKLRARIAELEEALAEWYLASDDYAEGAETAAHDHLNELAAECAAKREAKP